MMMGRVTIREFLKNLYKDAEEKGVLDRKIGTIYTGYEHTVGSTAGIILFEDDNFKEEMRVKAYYKRYEEGKENEI